MKKTIFTGLLILPVIFTAISNAELNKKYDYLINDCHAHFVNFIQETDGLCDLLKKMDESGVENIILFGLPVAKVWTEYDKEKPVYYDDNDAPVYYYSFTDVILAENIKKLPKEQQKRIYPMVCGFNPADKNGIDHIKRMIAMYPNFWVGIGEILTRHDDLTRMTYGTNPTANMSTLDPIYEYAAKNNLPVWIHSDIGNPIANDSRFLYEIEEAVSKHPKTKIVWCHIGNTREVDIKELPKITTRMLKEYSNFYLDLSWVVYDQIIAPNGKPNPIWVNIIEEFPDKFMIGTDVFGNFSKYKQTIRRYKPLLASLKPATAKKVASMNMFNLLPKKE